MNKIHKLRIILFTIMIIILLNGCSEQAAMNEQPETALDNGSVKIINEDIGPSQGGILNLFMIQPDTLNPLTTKNITVQHLSEFIFDSLFYEDEKGNIKGGLIKNYTLSDDGLILDIVLKDNILFHDGKALTADDIAFTIQAIKDAKDKSFYNAHVSIIDSVKSITKLDLRIVFNKADAEYKHKLSFPIVPAHVFKDWPIEGHSDSMKLIGTGPFKFNSFEENLITLTPNASWWRLNDLYGISHPIWPEGITFNVYSEESKMMEAFQKQEIDIAFMEQNNMDSYSQRSDLFYAKYESDKVEFLMFSSVGRNDSPMKQEEFRNVLINYLIGYHSLDPIGKGRSEISNYLEYENKDWEDTLNSLSNLGFNYDDSKNVLSYNKNGTKIPLILTVSFNALNGERQDVNQWIKAAMLEIGVQINQEETTITEQQALVKSGKYDIAILGCRIPEYTDLTGAMELVKESFGLRNQNSVILPLYRGYSSVLYNNCVRGPKNPTWKNIYNGWPEWYLVKSNK